MENRCDSVELDIAVLEVRNVVGDVVSEEPRAHNMVECFGADF